MLGQRRRRWPNIQTTWAQRLVFGGSEPVVAHCRDNVCAAGKALNREWAMICVLLPGRDAKIRQVCLTNMAML